MLHVTLDPHVRHHHVLLQSATGSHHLIFGDDWEAGLSYGGLGTESTDLGMGQHHLKHSRSTRLPALGEVGHYLRRGLHALSTA
jgi:hypothetical protein